MNRIVIALLKPFSFNRGPSVKDVGIDSIGVLFGITFVRLFCWIALGGNTKKRKRRRRRYYY